MTQQKAGMPIAIMKGTDCEIQNQLGWYWGVDRHLDLRYFIAVKFSDVSGFVAFDAALFYYENRQHIFYVLMKHVVM